VSRPVRALISDFGGVLTTPLIRSFAAYQDRSGVSMEDLGRALQRSADEHGEHPLFELERGHITEAEFVRRTEAHLYGVRLQGMRETYFEHLHPNRPMIELVRKLREQGLRTALLTNNVREWEPHWRAKLPEIEEVFEVVVDSAFVGMRKPEPGIYELTLERMGGGLEPGDCLFVDDLEVNCEAARELGMRTVRFESIEQAIPEIEAALGASGSGSGGEPSARSR
jgi:putative hydrolase of the HAD superfamily